MKGKYKGFEIETKRNKQNGSIHFDVYRDGEKVFSGFDQSDDNTVSFVHKWAKMQIDKYLETIKEDA